MMLFLRQAPEQRDQQDKRQHGYNQQPDGAFHRHDDSGSYERAHNYPNQHRQQKFHSHAWYEPLAGFQARLCASRFWITPKAAVLCTTEMARPYYAAKNVIVGSIPQRVSFPHWVAINRV